MMTTKKNYRLKDLLLNKESLDLLNEIADSLNMRNSDLARIILVNQLKEIKFNGSDSYSLAIIGIKSKNKSKNDIYDLNHRV